MQKNTRIVRIAMLAVGLIAAAGATAETRTLNDGVYTEAQAESGEALYAQHCLLCHDTKYFRPILKRWEGQPIGTLFTVIATSMPETNPGFLTLDEYTDILAYVLSLSRYAPGDTELTHEDGALDELIVEARRRN